jgi:hypothetical protein
MPTIVGKMILGQESRLKKALSRIDKQIERLFLVEHQFLELDGNKKALLAALTIKALGKSHAEREANALASEDWKAFLRGHTQKEAEYNQERRRYELLLKNFDAEYIEYKIESSAIKRQVD